MKISWNRQLTAAVSVAFVTAAVASHAYGHGFPIHVVGGPNQQLTVSNGLSLTSGFASMVWDPSEDAALQPATNNRLTSTYPGFDIEGIDPMQPLQFEVMSRPDYSSPGHPERWLWYWNTSWKVTDVPGDAPFHVVPLFGAGTIQVRQDALIAGPTSTMASVIGPHMNTHKHMFVYELRDSPSALPGVYAIFGRLIAPGFEPSEPMLLAFRHAIGVGFLTQAAIDINNAAVPSGDFNADGVVDAADYVVWRKTMNTGPDYNIWRTSFGAAVGAGAFTSPSGGSFSVPEPLAVQLLALLGASLTGTTGLRRRISRRLR